MAVEAEPVRLVRLVLLEQPETVESENRTVYLERLPTMPVAVVVVRGMVLTELVALAVAVEVTVETPEQRVRLIAAAVVVEAVERVMLILEQAVQELLLLPTQIHTQQQL
jgi:hypothetical protein